MTRRKIELHLPTRPPSYVSRETGAAEVGISPETWDRWVANGILPLPASGFPASTPRWRWLDVDRKLSGTMKGPTALQAYLDGIGKIRGSKKDSGREAA
jgi:hypothetical protein